MKKNKALFIIIGAIFLLQIAFGETIEEKSLAETAHPDFVVSDANTINCLETIYLKNMQFNSKEYYTIYSMNAEFFPATTKEAKIIVYLNPEKNKEAIETIKATDFKNNLHRIELPRSLLEEKNTIKTCLQTAFSTTKIVLKKESKIGTYKTADFKNNVVLSVDKTEPILGENITAKIRIKNNGSEKTKIGIYYWDVLMREKDMKLIRGQTSLSKELAPNEEIEMEYIVRAKRAVQMTFPAAIVYYTNTFGETMEEYSNTPTIFVSKPEFKAIGKMIPENTLLSMGGKTKINVRVKNEDIIALNNIQIMLVSDSITFDNETKTIQELEPKTIGYAEFTATSGFPGKQSIECIINLPEFETQNSCGAIEIEFQAPATNLLVTTAVILVIFGVIIYLYIYLK